jgi:hypothetical protein
MKEINFNKYKAAWKSEQSFKKRTLSEEDIQSFLKKNSKAINKLFKKSLFFDIVLKSIIGVSFIIIAVLFSSNMIVLVTSMLMFAGIIMAISFQGRMLKKIPNVDYARDNLKKVLEISINFYKNKYRNSLYVGALSNSLFVISGILYYFYFKYGEVRPFETDDYIVSGIVIIISFIFGAYVQIKQHNFQILQLEVCLTEINENTLNDLTIKNQKVRRRKMFFIFLLAIICGLLVFAFILARTS